MPIRSLLARRPGPGGRAVLLALICIGSFFINLGVQEVGLMEARNFVAAREMHDGGSWLLPTMNGALRLAKPPLPTWLVAAVMQLTGNRTSLWLMRLPSALGATLLVFGFWVLARRLVVQERTAWLAAVVLATTLLLLIVGRDGNGWDVYCYAFMVWALAALVQGWQSAGPAYGWFAAGGLLIGLSVLSKGPVAPYGMLLPFVVSLAWRGGWPQLRAHGRGVLLAGVVALAVGGAWPLYVYYHESAATLAVARLESNSWSVRHVKPLWFYLSFPVFTGLWLITTLAALAWPYARPRLRPLLPYGLVLTWAVLTLVFLSLIPEKKDRYLLPLMPPLALLAAALVQYWAEQAATRTDRRLQRIWAGLLTATGAVVPVGLAVVALPGFEFGSGRYWLSSAVFLVVAAAAAAGVRQPRPPYLATLTVLVTLLAPALLMGLYPQWELRQAEPDYRAPATVMNQHPELRRLPVYSLEEMHIKWIWAAGRHVPVWPTSKSQPPPQLPALVFALSRHPQELPPAWRRQLRVSLLDSFSQGDHREQGQRYLFLFQPKW